MREFALGNPDMAYTHLLKCEHLAAAAVLLWKGKALRLLGLQTAARGALSAAFRRKKDRSDDLLHAIQYERILAYEGLGQGSRARSELEKRYAQDPGYEDVAERLGVG